VLVAVNREFHKLFTFHLPQWLSGEVIYNLRAY
jgi:hypothetical protein